MSYYTEAEAITALASVCRLTNAQIREIVASIDPYENEWIEIPGSGKYQYCWWKHYPYLIIQTDGERTVYTSQESAAKALDMHRTTLTTRLSRANPTRVTKSPMGNLIVESRTCKKGNVVCTFS
jgi:hypothetical protein